MEWLTSPETKEGESPTDVDPHFWNKAFLLNALLNDFFGPFDREIVSSLEDYGIEWLYESDTYRIWLKFQRNRFFNNRIIWKEVKSSLQSTKSSGIDWRNSFSPLEPLNRKDKWPSKVVICRRKDVFDSFLSYFMYDVDDECEIILTSIFLSIWKNPYQLGHW
ncbi:coproporphyrinogen oxidase [Perkinsela sp. CCAP 1560/4]|nr:coproporphyrinogen oxidase [Perkinsela sp. CCAP 1560/4]|eukprot:KNH09618.1 coproporphyrinogen oxidase [Perkinsela sp. CCAP 1560/4]